MTEALIFGTGCMVGGVVGVIIVSLMQINRKEQQSPCYECQDVYGLETAKQIMAVCSKCGRVKG